MPERKPQNYANHTRFDPLFHFFALPVTLLTFLASLWQLYKTPGTSAGVTVITSAAMVVIVSKLRFYSLHVQDRVIRLEERLRLAEILPERLRARIGELTEGQLIALRFAPDEELPDLVEKALAGNWSRRQIKQAIRSWRPDYFRI